MNAALKPLLDAGWIDDLPPTRDEIEALLSVLSRSLDEASGPLKYPDTRFDLAYRAVLTAATIVVRAEGARVHRQRYHEQTFRALQLLNLPGLSKQSAFYDACRRKRNVAEYEMAGNVSMGEAQDLLQEAERLAKAVREWLAEQHADLT